MKTKTNKPDRSQLLDKGFDTWNEREKQAFMRALFGRRDIAAQRMMMS